MAIQCQQGHAVRGKPRNAYVTLMDDQHEPMRERFVFCEKHLADWLDELTPRTESNGHSNRGPFAERKCHWGDHELEGGWSAGAVFVMAYPDGAEGLARRALLCEEHLAEVKPALNLRGLRAR